MKGKLKDQRLHIDTHSNSVRDASKSLGQRYNASLKDSDQRKQLKKETTKGLVNIHKTLLPVKFKL